MRIGIILHPYGEKAPGGLPRMIYQWTKWMLAEDGKNQYVIFLKEEPKKKPDLPGENWHYEVLGSGLLWLDRLRGRTKTDVYIFNTPVLPLFFRPKRSIVIALDFPYKYLKPQNIKERMRHFFLERYHCLSLHRADRVVAISGAARKDCMKLFGVPEEKIAYIPQGYINICDAPQKEVALPGKFFLFVGTVKERKNVLRIVEAFCGLKGEHSELGHTLVIVGSYGGSYYEKLRSYIEENGLEEEVLFLGHKNDNELSYIYRRAEAVVFPSIVEATGNPIIEAMYCGVPVITSNICGPAELGEGAALLIDPYKTSEIQKAMKRIIFEKGLRDELIRKGRKQVKKFPWDRAARELIRAAERTAA